MEGRQMKSRILITLIALAGTALLTSPAQAWLNAPGSAPVGFNGYNSAIPRPIVLRGVNFKPDCDMLTHESTVILDVVAKTLKSRPHGKLEVAGHASAEGDAAHNQELSASRAKAVRDWLIFRGVPGESLSYHGYGARFPVADNVSAAGRELNRRVELVPVMPVAYYAR
jgi:outer membrane protein OmpA-like peptidoglycan-associated protein